MAWKCPNCGVSNVDGRRICEACSNVIFGELLLTATDTGKEVKMRIDTEVGQHLLRALNADDYRYASEPQFRLYKDSSLGGWAITSCSGIKNPTFYNGAQLADNPLLLENGSVITIGRDKMKITVQIVS